MGYKTKGGSQKVDLPDLDISTGTVITGGVIIVVVGAGIIYAIPWLVDKVIQQTVSEPWGEVTGWWSNTVWGQLSGNIGEQGIIPDSWEFWK